MLCITCRHHFNEKDGVAKFERDDEFTYESIEYKCPHCGFTNTEFIHQEKRQDWYFTFGISQAYEGKYHIINGSHNEARHKMFERFDNKWAFQYESAEAAGVNEFGLKRIM